MATRPDCTKNSQCKDGKICKKDKCVAVKKKKKDPVKKGLCADECRSSETCNTADGYCYLNADMICEKDIDCEDGKKCRDKECTGKFSEYCQTQGDDFKCYNDNTIHSDFMIDRVRGPCKNGKCGLYETCDKNICQSNKVDIDNRIAECRTNDKCQAVACDADHDTCDLYSNSTLIPVMGQGATTYLIQK